MSTAALIPANYTPKSFWKKPEGNAGKLMVAGLAAAGVYGLWLTLPFLLSVVWGTINLCIGLAILGVFGWLFFNPTVRCAVRNVFQSIARGMARCVMTIDPIGILQNNLDNMKKEKQTLDDTTGKFAGAENSLVNKIAAKKEEIKQTLAKSAEVQRRMAAEKDQFVLTGLKLKRDTYDQKAGLLNQAVISLSNLEAENKKMLVAFRRWSQISDAKIERTKMQVELLSEMRKDALEARKTLTIGKRLLQGDPEQLKMVDMAIEYITEDAAQTYGEIREFNNQSDKLFDDLDIENAANADLARQKFAELTAKLDASADSPTAGDQLQLSAGNLQTVPMTMSSDDSYQKLFVK
jgi:hypothetical protein